ncbi:N-acetylglucosaminyl-phosphatidylinositol de-N-acetylase [Engraulis encrasicolus]|uniref:N-acetylglucosaminyl-phosphatidylinositol de-N-acetylase n=1 Tax=Engraulis encrasicolus TaxID=184585 RepID=UPI002FD7606E
MGWRAMILYFAILFVALYLVFTSLISRRYNSTHLVSRIELLSNSSQHASCAWDAKETCLPSDAPRALLVTAHPDDECMFFAPSIILLRRQGISVHLLCLSSGDYYNQGALRKKELLDSAAVLGIPASQVSLIDHQQLKDDPKAEWSVALTSSIILKHIQRHSISLVLSFDGSGVSGHANHIALYKALSHLVGTGQIPDSCHVLALNSISVFRKYLSNMDLYISRLFRSDLLCTIGSKEYNQAKRAMYCHRSQLVWFRHLYIFFSRYMYINTYKSILAEKRDFKIY